MMKKRTRKRKRKKLRMRMRMRKKYKHRLQGQKPKEDEREAKETLQHRVGVPSPERSKQPCSLAEWHGATATKTSVDHFLLRHPSCQREKRETKKHTRRSAQREPQTTKNAGERERRKGG
jgi:hypothetical protein